MKKIIGVIAIGFLLAVMTSSTRAETFIAYLSSAQEVPTNASTATGYARVFLNEGAGTISFRVVFSGLSSSQTLSHIHCCSAIGVNSGAIITLGTVGGTSGTITGTSAITPTQIASLRAHQGYVNVHSVNFSGGEIRGQLGVKRPVDFDGDGRTDPSVLRFPSVAPPGVAPITYWNLNSTTGPQSISPWGDANTDFPAPGDFDGDGIDDISIYRDGATLGAQSAFWILQSSNNVARYYAWGVSGDQAVTRDYDGDGITDIAVFRRGSTAAAPTTWFIRRSSDNTAIWTDFGLTGNGTSSFDAAIPGDYDGDGKFDLAVYRFGQSPANYFIYRQSSDGAVKFVQFGNFNTDYIVPGDYDGDGKFDFCAVRVGSVATTPMFWWIRRSSDNTTSVRQFGLSSDRPTQGDYDGDARTDIAVYRGGATTSSQSYFIVLNSFDNTVLFKPWGLGGDFPVNVFDTR